MAITLNGTTGITTTGDYDAEDNDKILLGTGDDLKIWHNGTHSFIENSTGDLQLLGDHIDFWSGDGSENILECTKNGSVNLYYDNSKKFETISTGINVTGGIRLGGNNADNEMDDYEEGTYNPTWAGITNYGSGYNDWSYTKIGRLVNVLGTLRLKTTTNDGTDVSFTLPFTPAAQTNAGNTGKISVGTVMHNNVETGSGGLVTYVYGGNAYGYFYNNVEDSSWWILESQHLSLDDTLYVNFTYIT